MLIEISSELDFSSSNNNYLLAIENLASAARSGEHAIVADIKILEFLSEWKDLGVSARSLFKTLIRKWPQFASLERVVSKKIIAGEFSEVKKISANGYDEIQIPIAMFESRDLSQKTKLILEDLDDEPVYQLITDWFLVKRKSFLVSKPYICTPVHGGGERTAFVCKSIQVRETSLTLCIVDTDKKYPNCPFGKTASLVQSAHDENNYLNQAFYLETQEIENLIPLSIYEITLNKNPNNSAIRNAYESLTFLEAQSATKFFDFKKGICCAHLNTEAKDLNLKTYWTPLVGGINCVKDCDHTQCDNKGCKKQLIKNWPNSKDTRIEIESIRNGRQFDFDLSPWLSSEWERIGQKILNWCLRYDPIRT